MSITLLGKPMIERMLESGQLLSCPAENTLTAALLDSADDSLQAGEQLREQHPGPAYELAHEGLRKSLTAFLNEQGLRPSTAPGHHAVVVEAVEAQIGHVLGGLVPKIHAIRSTRNALSYPTTATRVSVSDANDALATASDVLRGIRTLVSSGQLPVFSQ